MLSSTVLLLFGLAALTIQTIAAAPHCGKTPVEAKKCTVPLETNLDESPDRVFEDTAKATCTVSSVNTKTFTMAGECKAWKTHSTVYPNTAIISYEKFLHNLADDRIIALLNEVGVLFVGVHQTEEMRDQKKGIYKSSCSSDPKHGNHALMLIGYAVEKGTQYWILKNSYGENYGENGYLHLARNAPNKCGIGNFVSFPKI